MTNKHINIQAKASDPSTFWQGKSGKYYRTLKEAKKDDGTGVYNPDSFRINKSLWSSHKHTIIYSLIAILFVCLIIYGQRIGKLEIKIK